MPEELIFWHKGLSYDARSAMQQPGFLASAENITFTSEGKQTLRPQFSKVNSTAVNAIHSIKRFQSLIIEADSTYLRWNNGSGDFTSLGAGYANSIWDFDEYKDFLHCINGTDAVLIDASGNAYNAKVDNPSTAPSGTSGAAGNPNGTYALYVSFFITWPNGDTYETGLSSASSDVTVTNQQISWSSIPVSTYSAISGTAPTIHRKLYRGPGTGGSLADIYYVATISDNTTTTYTDDTSDSQLAANGACYVNDYDVAPNATYLAYHYGRLFLLSSNRLYYSEAVAGDTAAENEVLMPIAFESNNWDDLRTSGFGHLDPQGLIAWGTYLYIPLKHTWIRKQGNDPDTWSYKKTWAQIGIAAPRTIALSSNPIGILGVSSPKGKVPGLSLFNGQTAQMITSPKLDDIFENDLNQDYIDKCRGICDGRYYYLLYPSGSNTEPDKLLAIDLSRFPDTRVAYWTDLHGQSIDVNDQDNQVYIGGSDGYVRQNTGSETIDVEVQTHDLIGGKTELANKEKTLKTLKYSLNTGGDDVTLTIYLDGDVAKWTDGSSTYTISGTDDSVQVIRNFPTSFKAYNFSFKITGTGLSTFELYSPWDVEFDF